MIFQKYSRQFDASTAVAEIFKNTSAWSQTHAKHEGYCPIMLMSQYI